MTVEEFYNYAVEFGKKKTDSFVNNNSFSGNEKEKIQTIKIINSNNSDYHITNGGNDTNDKLFY